MLTKTDCAARNGTYQADNASCGDLPPIDPDHPNATGTSACTCDRDQLKGTHDYCNGEDCPDDPTYTCSFTGCFDLVAEVKIPGARMGDILLGPADGDGIIGGLLSSLHPSQHFDHTMVVVDTRGTLLRHTTASISRLSADEYSTGSIDWFNSLSLKVPKDGVNHDHLLYAWPGSVTQSVSQVWRAQWEAGYHGSDLQDPESTTPSPQKYTINPNPFQTVTTPSGAVVSPILITACADSDTTAALHARARIADKVMSTYAHYRFYCYTNPSIYSDSRFWSPPRQVLPAKPRFDGETNQWFDWTWSDANPYTPITTQTIPAVCSSAVWVAVQMANADGGPQIRLDQRESPQEAVAAGICPSAFPPDYAGDVVDPTTPDGLYAYTEDARIAAGEYLKGKVVDHVYQELRQKLRNDAPAISALLDGAGRDAFMGTADAAILALQGLIDPTGLLTYDFVEGIYEALYEMPDDIGNQLCNAFAFDCVNAAPEGPCYDAHNNPIDSIDSTNWHDAPGVGQAISPENILFWDPPLSANEHEIVGLYGYSRVVQPQTVKSWKPRYEKVHNVGKATIRGYVKYGTNPNVKGATVTANCATPQEGIVTDGGDSGFTLEVDAGARYYVRATMYSGTGQLLFGAADTGNQLLEPNSSTFVVITLIGPPSCVREIRMEGSIQLYDEQFLGSTEHVYPSNRENYSLTKEVDWGVPQPNWNANPPEWDCGDPNVGDPNFTVSYQVTVEDGAMTGEIDFEGKIINPQFDVQVTVTARINPGQPDEQASSQTVTVSAGATQVVVIGDLTNRGHPFADIASFKGKEGPPGQWPGIRISNLPTGAYE